MAYKLFLILILISTQFDAVAKNLQNKKLKKASERLIEKAYLPAKRFSKHRGLKEGMRGLTLREFNLYISSYQNEKLNESKKISEKINFSSQSDEDYYNSEEDKQDSNTYSSLFINGGVTYQLDHLFNETKLELSKSGIDPNVKSYIESEIYHFLPGGAHTRKVNWKSDEKNKKVENFFSENAPYQAELRSFSYFGQNKIKNNNEVAKFDFSSIISFSELSLRSAFPVVENSKNFLQVDWQICAVNDLDLSSKSQFASRLIADFDVYGYLRHTMDHLIPSNCYLKTMMYPIDPKGSGQKVIAPPLPNGNSLYGVNYSAKVVQFFAEEKNILGQFRAEANMKSLNSLDLKNGLSNFDQNTMALLYEKQFSRSDKHSVLVKSWMKKDLSFKDQGRGASINIRKNINSQNFSGNIYSCQQYDSGNFHSKLGFSLENKNGISLRGESNYINGSLNNQLNLDLDLHEVAFNLNLTDEYLGVTLNLDKKVPGDLKIYYKSYYGINDSFGADYNYQIVSNSSYSANVRVLAEVLNDTNLDFETTVAYSGLPVVDIVASAKYKCKSNDGFFSLSLQKKN
jgi:hypothetical protein